VPLLGDVCNKILADSLMTFSDCLFLGIYRGNELDDGLLDSFLHTGRG
jgi:hypothetical protein